MPIKYPKGKDEYRYCDTLVLMTAGGFFTGLLAGAFLYSLF